MATRSPSKAWSETRKGRIAVLAALIGLFVLVFWLAMKSRQLLASEPPSLVVDDGYLWFGEVWEDPEFVWKLPIRNTTDREIHIPGFDASCSCLKIEPSSVLIPAGATEEVRLILNLVKAQRQGNPDGRDFTVAIHPKISRRAASQRAWVVHGIVKTPFSIHPPVVDFEESLTRGHM